MQSIGLSAFVAMVGLGAGPHFMPAIREAGLSLFLGGIVVTLVPLVAGLYFGRYVLKANPLLLLGGLSFEGEAEPDKSVGAGFDDAEPA